MHPLDFFPLPTPRPAQIKALEFVKDVVEKGYRDVVLSLPTGTGKTSVGAAIAAWAQASTIPLNEYKVGPGVEMADGGYVLVHQKVLQDQMERELTSLGSKASAGILKSSVEYPCAEFKRCAIGKERKCSCRGNACPYTAARDNFLASAIAVTNYSYFFTERVHSGKFPPRYAMVLDECHSLARGIIRHVDCQVTEATIADYAPTIDPHELRDIAKMDAFVPWVRDVYLPVVRANVEELAALASDAGASDSDAKAAHECQQHYCKTYDGMTRMERDPKRWVFWQEEARDRTAVATARPLDAYPYFDELVGTAAPLRVYMSAWPGEKGNFCKELGLAPERVAWLSMGSPFEVKNRHVVTVNVGSMSRRTYDTNLPRALAACAKIATSPRHAGERGIIHTHSYKLAESIVEHLRKVGLGDRVVYPTNADERDEALARHAAFEGSILVSPSVGEGFDFKDDLARWQVVVKAPWPSLGDPHTKAKADADDGWYMCEAAKSLLQTCGRIVRNGSDFGTTYVLDDDCKRLYPLLPKWFKRAIVDMSGNPLYEGV